MRRTISSIHVGRCLRPLHIVLGLGLMQGVVSQDHCLLSRGKVTTKVLEIEIQEEADNNDSRDFEAMADLLNEIGNVPSRLSELFCPLAAASDRWQLDQVNRLRGPRGETAGFLPKAEKCAVVSNSGVLLNYQYGEEIDSADMVFRFNDAAVGGEFLKFVGERDDIRIVNGEFGQRVLKEKMTLTPGTEYVILRPLPRQLDDALRAQDRHEEAHIVLGNPKLGGSTTPLLFRMFGNEKGMATSGFLGVGLAMTLCDEVRAYGFAETPMSHRSTFHYYGDQRSGQADRNPQHKLAAKEKQFWRMVALNDNVNTTDVSVLPGTRKLNCTVAQA